MKQYARTTAIFLFLLLSVSNVQAQTGTVTGTVTNAEGQVVSGAKVFIALTTLSTTTDAQGAFSINSPGFGAFNVVAVTSDESLGVVTVTPDLTAAIAIKLAPKPALPATGSTALSRAELLDFFHSTAFSWTKNSEDVLIVNPDVLILNHDPTTNVMIATASAAFTFRNDPLGYEVTIYDFQMGGNQVAFGWSGHVLFTPIASSNSKDQKNWDKAREKTYEGSQRHFLKALADEKLKKEEFGAYFAEGPGSQSDHSPVFEAGLRSVYGAPQPIMFTGKAGASKRLDFSGWVRVAYFGSGGDTRWERYIDRYWPVSELSQVMKSETNISFIKLPDYQAIFDVSGILWPTKAPSIQAMGYWSFFRLADLLPSDWTPVE